MSQKQSPSLRHKSLAAAATTGNLSAKKQPVLTRNNFSPKPTKNTLSPSTAAMSGRAGTVKQKKVVSKQPEASPPATLKRTKPIAVASSQSSKAQPKSASAFTRVGTTAMHHEDTKASVLLTKTVMEKKEPHTHESLGPPGVETTSSEVSSNRSSTVALVEQKPTLTTLEENLNESMGFPNILIQEPHRTQVLSYLACRICKWQFVGRYLGVSDEDIEAIRGNNFFSQELCYKVLHAWCTAQATRLTATYSRLAEALRNIQREDLLNDLQPFIPNNTDTAR